jgi:transposase
LLKAYDKGNSENTIDYLRYLLNESRDQRLLIFWDGATYHRSKEIGGFLSEVNQTLPSDEWKIHRGPLCA